MSAKAAPMCSFQADRKPSCRDSGSKNCMQHCRKLVLQCPVSTHSTARYCKLCYAPDVVLWLVVAVGCTNVCMTVLGVGCRRVTNRESAKRIRDKREEQMTLMSEQVHYACLPSMLLVPKP